jgi:DNA-binding transcriptional regulator YdaS (Cro superfamily)
MQDAPTLTSIKLPIHPLKRWLFEHQVVQMAFATTVGLSQSYLSDLMSWRRRPSLAAIDAIKAATDGEITAEHFTREPI